MRNASYAYHLGMIQRELEDYGPARRNLEQAVRTNPAFSPLAAPLARQALEALGEPPPGGPGDMQPPPPPAPEPKPEPKREAEREPESGAGRKTKPEAPAASSKSPAPAPAASQEAAAGSAAPAEGGASKSP